MIELWCCSFVSPKNLRSHRRKVQRLLPAYIHNVRISLAQAGTIEAKFDSGDLDTILRYLG